MIGRIAWWTARYDVTNPQTEVSTPGSQTYVQLVGYTLDGLGNRSQVQTTLWGGAPATTTYASDVVNQYTAVGGVTRAHDSNGNLTDDGTHQYLYDFKNRLVEVKLKSTGATVSTYRYDAQGRRVEKDVGGTVTRYILDGVTVVEEFDGTDTWQASYIHGDRIDHPCAMDRADIADVDGDANTTEVLRFHYAQNALGSVSEMTSPSGAVVEWVTYDAYGLPTVRDQNGNVVASSAVGNPFLYTGREWDVEFEKYFYRARTYDPEKGRFLQRDPLGYVDGLGPFEYVRSRPATLVDPMGAEGGPPKPIRIQYPKSTNPDQKQAAKDANKAAKAAVKEHNKKNPDNKVAEDVADSIGKPYGNGYVGGLMRWKFKCRRASQDKDGTRYQWHVLEWDGPPIIVEPDDGSLSDHEDGHVEVTEKARKDANKADEDKPTDVGEMDEDERKELQKKKGNEGREAAKQANETYDETTKRGTEQGNYQGGGNPNPKPPAPSKPTK